MVCASVHETEGVDGMTEQERKDADIVRAARGCGKGNCFACSYDEYTACKTMLIIALVGVIDRKDKRIEELEERIAIMTEGKEQTEDGLPITW